MKKSSIDGNRYLVYLWELGELPVYIYWWCWRFAAPESLRSGHSGNQGFFTNAICERIHSVLGTMIHTSEIDMAKSVEPADIDTFIDNAAWAIPKTNHKILNASPGTAHTRT